jgi:tellurite resistance protein TerC
MTSIVNPPLWVWALFHAIIIVLVIVDLLKLESEDDEPSLKKTGLLTALWLGVGLGFGVFILHQFGSEPALLYLTSFVAEKSLSLDNMFVFYAIFAYFGVPYKYQHKVLTIGILSAVFFRALFILGGIILLQLFHWMIFVFGAILIVSGLKLAKRVEEEVDPEKNPIIRFTKKHLPLTSKYHGSKFIVRENGRKVFTPMILVLLAIETTDIIFAVDSVPAVLAITTDFFIAYTSNIMAILGLRALYLFVALIIERLEYLHVGLGVLLVYLGIKMILGGFEIKIPALISLTILLTIILVSAFGSFILTKQRNNVDDYNKSRNAS